MSKLARPSIVARAPVTFEVADGAASHAPMILASVNGVEARLVIDTGADVHLLTAEFADQLGLARTPGEDGTDHGGTAMPSWRVPNVTLELAETEVPLTSVVAIPPFDEFRRMGISGIVSPQLMRSTGAVVIDLVADELLLVDGNSEIVADWLRAEWPALVMLVLDRDPKSLMVVVPARVNLERTVPTTLNTGGKGTEFSRSSVPTLWARAHSRTSERLGGGVSGADVTGTYVGPQVLSVGGRRVPINALAIRETMDGPQGTVGMDVLRGTVLVCAADRNAPVWWLIPN